MTQISALRICHLYPDQLNFYADRGNVEVLQRRLEWRGIDHELVEMCVGDPMPTDCNLYVIGGGQDRDLAKVARDLQAKAGVLRKIASTQAVIFAVGGGFLLLGRTYTTANGQKLEGASIFDTESSAGPTRLVGDVVALVNLSGKERTLVGWENHASRTSFLSEFSASESALVDNHDTDLPADRLASTETEPTAPLAESNNNALPTDQRSPQSDPRPPQTVHQPPQTDRKSLLTDHQPPQTDHRPPKTDHRPTQTRALGKVLAGNGNNGKDGLEGAVVGRCVGTNLHGPLLPKNPWLADILLRWALEHAGINVDLEPLDDDLESKTHTQVLNKLHITS